MSVSPMREDAEMVAPMREDTEMVAPMRTEKTVKVEEIKRQAPPLSVMERSEFRALMPERQARKRERLP